MDQLELPRGEFPLTGRAGCPLRIIAFDSECASAAKQACQYVANGASIHSFCHPRLWTDWAWASVTVITDRILLCLDAATLGERELVVLISSTGVLRVPMVKLLGFQA